MRGEWIAWNMFNMNFLCWTIYFLDDPTNVMANPCIYSISLWSYYVKMDIIKQIYQKGTTENQALLIGSINP